MEELHESEPKARRPRAIQLTQGFVALVDDADFEALSRWHWSVKEADGRWYAVRGTCRGPRNSPVKHQIKMHRQILGVDDPSVLIDHRNGNGLDNQRGNLRIATNAQNGYNARKRHGTTTSKYKGVTWDTARGKWTASIMVSRRRYALGRFENEEDAARAYDDAAQRWFGEFSRLNFGGAQPCCL
jgi:hypothetical protein